MSSRAKIVVLICGLAIFSYLVWDFGIENIVLNIRRTGWWFLPVFGIWAIVYIFNSLAWYVILRDHTKEVGFRTIYALTVTGFGLNYVTPFLNLGGEPYRVLSLRETVGLHRAVSSVILYNMVRMMSHFFFWLGAIIMVFVLFPVSPMFGVLLGAIFVLVLLLISFFFSRHKKGIFESLLNWVGTKRALRRVALRFQNRRDALLKIDGQVKQLYNGHRGTFYTALTYEFLARIIASLEFYFILRAIGYAPSFVEALYINAGSSLVLNLLFFVPFELGTREGGLFLVMESIGYPPGIGVYIGIANRVREFFWILIGFFFILITGRRQVKGRMLDMIEANGKP